MTLRGILLHLVLLITAIRKRVFFEYQFSSKLSNRLQTTKIDSWVTSMEKTISSNSLINIYLLANYKTMLKGDLANQWSLYTQPFLIYSFFYSVAFWLCQHVCLLSITKYHILSCTQAHSINYVLFILFISLFLSFFFPDGLIYRLLYDIRKP